MAEAVVEVEATEPLVHPVMVGKVWVLMPEVASVTVRVKVPTGLPVAR